MLPIAAATFAPTVTSEATSSGDGLSDPSGHHRDIRLDHRQRLVDLIDQAEVALDGGALKEQHELTPTPSAAPEVLFPPAPDEAAQSTPATVASYRDALRMLILFAAARLRKKPGALALEELIEISFSLFSTNSRRSGTIPSPRATPAWPRSDLSSATSLPPTRHPSASPNAC
ncbi:MAG: hypothetical protein EOR04_32530 [Mesorhizobium sp.]|nr:MAG: hypothetical protein EOR04_32530 [Mesorhizobium sp.]